MPLFAQPLDLATLDTLAVDSYAIFVGEDERPLWGLGGLLDWRLAGGLSKFLQEGRLAGHSGESFLTPTAGVLPGGRIFAFGLGPLNRTTPEAFTAVAEKAAATLAKAKVASVAVGLPEQPNAAAATKALARAFQSMKTDVHVLGASGRDLTP